MKSCVSVSDGRAHVFTDAFHRSGCDDAAKPGCGVNAHDRRDDVHVNQHDHEEQQRAYESARVFFVRHAHLVPQLDFDDEKVWYVVCRGLDVGDQRCSRSIHHVSSQRKQKRNVHVTVLVSEERVHSYCKLKYAKGTALPECVNIRVSECVQLGHTDSCPRRVQLVPVQDEHATFLTRDDRQRIQNVLAASNAWLLIDCVVSISLATSSRSFRVRACACVQNLSAAQKSCVAVVPARSCIVDVGLANNACRQQATRKTAAEQSFDANRSHVLDTLRSLVGLGSSTRDGVGAEDQQQERFIKYCSVLTRGVLIYGPRGVGKTFVVREAFCNQYNLRHVYLDAVELLASAREDAGAVADGIRAAFNLADELRSTGLPVKASSRIVLIIDNLHVIAQKRASRPSESQGSNTIASQRVVAMLLSLLDGAKKRLSATSPQPALVIGIVGTTPTGLDQALRRPGRFDCELYLKPPDALGRRMLLNALHATEFGNCQMAPDVDRLLGQVARKSVAFVAADILHVWDQKQTLNELAHSVQRYCPLLLRGSIGSEWNTNTAARSSTQQEEGDAWDQVGGYEQVKRRLRICVEWPFTYADAFERLAIRRARGVLMHGPPGCSKTSLARAMAASSASTATFFHVSGADIFSCYLGEAERIVRDLFSLARAASPSIIFIDELDAIVGERALGDRAGSSSVHERVLSTLLNEMDGISGGPADGMGRHDGSILVVGATNRIDMIDGALLRPGRFDEIVEVPLPDKQTRGDIVRLQGLAGRVDDEQIEGKSGADIVAICHEILRRGALP
ncbi:Cell division cycle protein 48-like [Porphyridium purpureum]|uniref:Cell division cycle protein 48-like n=1 Tax=Porphyridium purpureum TaxID=35688 RepID=A0A5J4YNV3_PORPP|nr:Cell division cycle protein 48-like [Porphyridium purpureum]|eukprot:POR0471..scf295_9